MASPVTTGTPDLPPLPLPGAAPKEIRAALHPEYREEFDRAYRDSLVEAARSLELEGVHKTLEHWRARSWITRDRAAHRQMVRRAAEILTGQEPPADEPVSVTEARL